MAQVNAYLTFNGNCEQAFNFYKSVFGGDFPYVGKFKDMPADSDKKLSPEEGEMIMHISLPISKETVIMGSDTGGEWSKDFKVGNNISLSINTESEEEAKRIFNALSAGGIITMPLDKTFWGAFFGMFVDKFGVNWMVNYDYQQTK